MVNMIPTSNTITFNESKIKRQYFYLPYPVTQHILWNANAEVLWKLYQTCKYFYKKRPYCIVDEMEMDFEEQVSMKINNTKFRLNAVTNMDIVNNIWINKKLELWQYNEALMSKIIQCDAEEIDVNIPTLSMKELITLTKSGNVKRWDSPYTNIIDYDGKPLSLEKLLNHIPNAVIIDANVHYVIHPNPVTIASVPRKNKVKWLSLRCDHAFNADLFFDLLKKTIAHRAFIHLYLKDQVAAENFKAEMDVKLDAWMPQSEKPLFVVDVLLNF